MRFYLYPARFFSLFGDRALVFEKVLLLQIGFCFIKRIGLEYLSLEQKKEVEI